MWVSKTASPIIGIESRGSRVAWWLRKCFKQTWLLIELLRTQGRCPRDGPGGRGAPGRGISKKKDLRWQDLDRKVYVDWVGPLEKVWTVVPEISVRFLPLLFNCAAIMNKFWSLAEPLYPCLSNIVPNKRENLRSSWEQAPPPHWSMEGLRKSCSYVYDFLTHETEILRFQLMFINVD